MDNEATKTPILDLRISALTHYNDVSTKNHHYISSIPRAINFYYDFLEGERKLIVPLEKIRKISRLIDFVSRHLDKIDVESDIINEGIKNLHESITEIYKDNIDKSE